MDILKYILVFIAIIIAVTLYRTWFLKAKYFRLFGNSLIYCVFVGGLLVWFPIFKKEDDSAIEKLRLKINKHLFLFYVLLIMLLISIALLSSNIERVPSLFRDSK